MLVDYADLGEEERTRLNEYFHRTVFLVLAPLAFDPGRPFPHISNLSLNLAVVVQDARGEERFARVKIPDTLPQLVPVPAPEGGDRSLRFVWLEQLIIANLQALFPGLEIKEAHPFHVTRDAEDVHPGTRERRSSGNHRGSRLAATDSAPWSGCRWTPGSRRISSRS